MVMPPFIRWPFHAFTKGLPASQSLLILRDTDFFNHVLDRDWWRAGERGQDKRDAKVDQHTNPTKPSGEIPQSQYSAVLASGLINLK